MKYSLLKRISAFVLAFALVMTTAFNAVGTTQANAAKKATVSAKGATVTVGASKSIKVSIKCKAKAKATIKVAVVKGATGKVTKKVTNSNAKKAAKTCKSTIKVTGKKAGKVKLSITPYINGKKAGKAKKITVTVKAAPATTTEAATTTTQAATTTEAPKLEGITVTADTTEIGPGGQAKLTVAATNAVGIASVTYKSSNDYIATVDEEGVVTGRNSSDSPVVITVTATDTYGNVVTQTIQIKVIKLVDAKITLADASKEVSLVVGQTHKITAVVDPKGYTLTYKPADTSIVSVSADGTMTALKEGDTTVTVGAAGTNGSAVVKVSVKATSIAIADAYASKANQVTVVFTGKLTAAEREAIDIKLTYGGEQKVTASFDASGNAILTKAGEFDPGDNYVVSISAKDGKTVALDSNKDKLSKTFKIDKVKATTFEIKPSQVLPWGNGIKVFFAIKDQYGTPMKTQTSDKCNIRLSCPDYPALSFIGKIHINALSDGEDENYPCYFTADFDGARTDSGYTTATLSKATVQVNGDLINDSTIAAKATTISLEPLSIKEVKITSVVNASGDVAKPVQDDNNVQTYEVKYTAIDTNNQNVDLSAYASYANRVSFNVTGYDNYKGPAGLGFNGTAVVPTSLQVLGFANLTDAKNGTSVSPTTGKFFLRIPAGSYGKFNVYAAVGSSTSTYPVEVLSTAAPDQVALADGSKTYKMKPSQGSAGGNGDGQLVPLSFKDQRGNAIAAPTSATDFNKLFNIVGGAAKVTGVYYYDATKKIGYLEVDTNAAPTGEYAFTINRIGEAVTSTKNSGTVTINVGDAPIANSIVLDKTSVADSTDKVITLLDGETKDIIFYVNDQYGTRLTGAQATAATSKYTFTASAPRTILSATSFGTDLAAGNTSGGSDATMDDTEWTAPAAITTAVTHSAVACKASKSEVAVGNVAEVIHVTATGVGESTLTIGLANGSTAVNNSTKTFKFKVIAAPTSFETTVDTDGALTNGKLVSGSKIKVKVSAKTTSGVVTDYAGTSKSIKVYEEWWDTTANNGAGAYVTSNMQTYASGTFDKGVLTLEGFETKHAGNNRYAVEIFGLSSVTAVQDKADDHNRTSSDTAVVAGTAAKLVIADDGAKKLSVTVVDAGGNTVADYVPSDAQIKVSVTNAAGVDITDEVFTTYSVTGKSGKYIDATTCTTGVMLYAGKADVPANAKVSFTIDGLEGTQTFTGGVDLT